MDSSTNAAKIHLDSNANEVMKKIKETHRLQIKIDSALDVFERQSRKLRELQEHRKVAYILWQDSFTNQLLNHRYDTIQLSK